MSASASFSPLARYLRRGAALIAVLAFAAACTPREEFNGARIDPDRLDRVKQGNLSRDEVRRILGTPSSTSISGEGKKDTWYYISRETKGYAFLDPDVTFQRVVVVDFDETGMVSKVREIGAEEAREVKPSGTVTSGTGQEQGVVEQIKGKIDKLTDDKPDPKPIPVNPQSGASK